MAEERRSELPRVQKGHVEGRNRGGKQGRQQTKKTPLEMVWGECGEPVARQRVHRSGSKRLFLSSMFPGSRLAAIPGTGVTFPAEPTEQ